MHNLAIVVPIFNHAEQFKEFLPKLLSLGAPVILVDDGSREANEIESLAKENGLIFAKNEKNLGKGAAFCRGAEKARELGFTHVFQIDADGQHGIGSFEDFKKASVENPDAVINGCPVYENAPASRFYGRKITNFWVALEVPSVKIRDAMCGFRIYPLKKVSEVMHSLKFARMGFDIEIIVRLARAGCQIINMDVAVNYPENGASNFRMIKDNVSISALHALLCAEGIFKFLKEKIFIWKRR